MNEEEELSLPLFLQITALCEHIHVRLIRIFFPLMLTVSLLTTNDKECQATIFFLTFCLVLESQTSNINYFYSYHHFQSIRKLQIIIFLWVNLATKPIFSIFILVKYLDNFLLSLIISFILLEGIITISYYIIMILYFKVNEEICDSYILCRKMMEGYVKIR